MAKMAPIPRTSTSKPAENSTEDSRIAFLTLRQPLKEKKTDVWVTSTACSGHIANDIKWFQDFIRFTTPRKVKGIGFKPALAWGSGTILLPALTPNGKSRGEVHDVWFTPTAPCNMLSLGRMEKDDIFYDGWTSSLMFKKSETIIASIESWNDLKIIKLDIEAIPKPKIKSKDNNNDNQIDISEFFKSFESPDQPVEPPVIPVEPVDPPEPSEFPEPPESSDDPPECPVKPLKPNEADDTDIDEEELPLPQTEHAILKEEDQEEDREDTLSQRHSYATLKASNFASNPDISKTYRVARYGCKWQDWKSAIGKQMRGFNIHGDWVDLLKSLGYSQMSCI
jgi:hypothetical protein